ncbi:FtsX-like permease family protein [Candidatus Dependentiae bacterium]
MRKLPLFLAWRYLKGSRREKSISTMVIICFLGICIGTFALALVASVMNGFEKVTHEKMQSIHPQIILHSNGQELNIAKISQVLVKEFPEIQSFSPSAIKQVICQADNPDSTGEYNIVIMKGVDPNKEPLVCNIQEKITHALTGAHTLKSVFDTGVLDTGVSKTPSQKTPGTHNGILGKVLIGKKLAESLNVYLGEKINLFFSKDETIKRKKINLKQKSVIIGGIFKTGIQEFDNNLIIGSLGLFQKLFKNIGVTHMSIKLKTNAHERNTIKKLRKRFGKSGIQAYSWKELYPALVEALELEKYAMFVILALITLVASMSIVSLLFMQITQKRGDIAILKAMGMPQKKISRIFLYLGMAISLAGTLVGLLLAYIAGWTIERYPLIKLPDAYYVTHLPAKMQWHIFVAVFVVVIVLSFFSTWLPARKTRKINISQVLRFEG